MTFGVALAVGLLVAALAPNTHAEIRSSFDGVYDLRSTTPVANAKPISGKPSCSLDVRAKPLHIVGGYATLFFGRHETLGHVGPRGDFLLSDSDITREFTGRIDDRGTVRGYLNTFDGCGYELTLQKRR